MLKEAGRYTERMLRSNRKMRDFMSDLEDEIVNEYDIEPTRVMDLLDKIDYFEIKELMEMGLEVAAEKLAEEFD